MARVENADLCAQLADANDENERLRAEVGRLKSALQEKVIGPIAGKLAAVRETKPTVNDVVGTAVR